MGSEPTKCYACRQPAPNHTADCAAVAIDNAPSQAPAPDPDGSGPITAQWVDCAHSVAWDEIRRDFNRETMAEHLNRYLALRVVPASGPEERVVLAMAEKYAGHWQDRDDAYWFARLTQEVGELGSSLVGDHADTPEHELAQIGSIAINWLRKRASRPAVPVSGERDWILDRRQHARIQKAVWTATDVPEQGNPVEQVGYWRGYDDALGDVLARGVNLRALASPAAAPRNEREDVRPELRRIASALRNGGGVGHEVARIEAMVERLTGERNADGR